MSGRVGIGVRLNDGTTLYARGHTDSAYSVFSYDGLFEGDDAGARAFLKEWNAVDEIVPDCLLRDEYGSFFVDFVARRIVVDRDEDVGISTKRFSPGSNLAVLTNPWIQGMMDAGRVELVWRKGEHPPQPLRRAYADAIQGAGIIDPDVHHRHGVNIVDFLTVKLEVALDLSPFSVVMHPEGSDEGRLAYVRDAEDSGLRVHPHYRLATSDWIDALNKLEGEAVR